MKSAIKLTALFCSLSILCSSCGVMFGGSRFHGSVIAKDHPKAEIYLNGRNIGRGAANFIYPRNQQLSIELRKEGCESKEETFTYAFRTGNFILTALTFGLLGIVVDVATGASFKPDHKNDQHIERISTDVYLYTVEYPDCPTEKVVIN